ncbi:hypothetical protein ACFL6I_09890 [candidate division KSB1 bacterium]
MYSFYVFTASKNTKEYPEIDSIPALKAKSKELKKLAAPPNTKFSDHTVETCMVSIHTEYAVSNQRFTEEYRSDQKNTIIHGIVVISGVGALFMS